MAFGIELLDPLIIAVGEEDVIRFLVDADSGRGYEFTGPFPFRATEFGERRSAGDRGQEEGGKGGEGKGEKKAEARTGPSGTEQAEASDDEMADLTGRRMA